VTELDFCAHRAILLTPGHAHQLTSRGLLRWDDLFSGWTVSIWRHGNWTRGARFLIREKSHYTILPLESRNQKSAQISGFWIPMVKCCNGIFLWSKIEPHTGLGFCDHRSILFTPGHAHQLTSPDWIRWDDLFSGWTVSIWRHGWLFGNTGIEPEELDFWSEKNRITGVILPLQSRNQKSALIREKSHYTILPLESRNQKSAQISGFWIPMVKWCNGIFLWPLISFPDKRAS
jgi:hypothetical protein